jgi:cysteine desulfurase
VYREGIVRLADIEAALTDETTLISVMQVNNELGTIQPIKQISDLVKARRAAGQRHLHLHTDAVQAVGKIPVDVRDLGVDLLSLSGHKIHAPKGVGALFVRRGVRVQAQSHGGHHERDRRAGTESVPLVVALGKACELERLHLQEFITRVGDLRDSLEREIIARIPDVSRNGDTECRVPHISNFNFDHCEGEGLMIALDLKGIAVSTGSACASGSIEPSHVLTAIGLNHENGRGTLRFSLSKETTPEDIASVVETLPVVVEKLRRISPKVVAR